jgi:hypothetical protein
MAGPIEFTQKGSFNKTERYLRRLSEPKRLAILESYATQGVNALSNATPVDSSETANSWSYSIVQRPGYYSIRFHNSHVEDGIPIAILIQYGHGTGTGGYVQGRDYINPAVRPIFEEMANKAWEEVTRV